LLVGEQAPPAPQGVAMTTVSRPNPKAQLGLNELLGQLRERRWTLHVFGPRESPDFISASLLWGGRADVIHLRSEKSATAYRMVLFPNADLFAPKEVEWQYHQAPTWTLRAILGLPAPGQHGAPTGSERANALCSVPQEIRRRQATRRSGLNQPPGWSWP
jgi:hypothetical protein